MSHLAVGAPSQQRTTEFRLFGPDILIRNGEPVGLPTGGPRELLALLLLKSDRRVSEREFQGATRMRRVRSTLFSSVALIRDALSGTGITIDVIGNRYKPTDVLVCRLEGESLVVDLYQCGPHILSALRADNAQDIVDELANAWEIMDGPPLAGLKGTYFTERRRLITEARESVLELASALIEGDSLAARRPMFDRFKHDLGLRFEHLKQQAADSTPQPSQEPIHGLKLRFLKSMEGNSIGRAWRLPLSDSNRGSERVLDLSTARVAGMDGEKVAAVTRWWADNQRALRMLQQSLDTSAIAVSIYLEDGETHEAVEKSVDRLLSETGLETYGHEEPIIGSWYRKLWARTREETEHLSAAQLAAEIERKVRIEVFDKAQAAIDNQQAAGAAALIAALQGEERACIRVGSILVIKVDGLVLVNNLTQIQLAWLERNQMLLRDPEALLKGLEALPDPMRDLVELPSGSASHGAL